MFGADYVLFIFVYSENEEVNINNYFEEVIKEDLKDDMKQPPSNEFMANSLGFVRFDLKAIEHITDSLFNNLNNIGIFEN